MNYQTSVRPLSEVLALWGVVYGDTDAPLLIPFSPVRYLGIS